MKTDTFRNVALGIAVLPMAALTHTSHAAELLGTRLLGKCDNGYLYLLEEVDHQREALRSKSPYGYQTCMARANDPEPCKELWKLEYGPRDAMTSEPGGLDNVSVADRQQQRWAKQHQIEQSKGVRLTSAFGYSEKDAWGCKVLNEFRGTNYTGCQGRLSYLDPTLDIQKKCEAEQHSQNSARAERMKKMREGYTCRRLKEQFDAVKEQETAAAGIARARLEASSGMNGCGELNEAW